MPKLPQLPDELRPRCVWHDCGNLADSHWHRNKWRYRLYCQRHRRAAAASRNFTGGPWWRRRDEYGRWWVKVAPHRWVLQQVAIARQLRGVKTLRGTGGVRMKNGDWSSFDRSHIIVQSKAEWLARKRVMWAKARAREKAEAGG